MTHKAHAIIRWIYTVYSISYVFRIINAFSYEFICIIRTTCSMRSACRRYITMQWFSCNIVLPGLFPEAVQRAYSGGKNCTRSAGNNGIACNIQMLLSAFRIYLRLSFLQGHSPVHQFADALVLRRIFPHNGVVQDSVPGCFRIRFAHLNTHLFQEVDPLLFRNAVHSCGSGIAYQVLELGRECLRQHTSCGNGSSFPWCRTCGRCFPKASGKLVGSTICSGQGIHASGQTCCNHIVQGTIHAVDSHLCSELARSQILR